MSSNTTSWAYIAEQNQALLTRTLEKLTDAERQRDEQTAWRGNVSAALRSWDMFETGEWAGDKDGWGYHFELIRFLIRHYESTKDAVAQRDEARALILAYAAWDRRMFPPDVLRVPEEQALVDYAAALAAQPQEADRG